MELLVGGKEKDAPPSTFMRRARTREGPVRGARSSPRAYPHVAVMAEEGDELVGEAVDRPAPRADRVEEFLVLRFCEELAETEGVEVEHVHLTRGIPAALVDRDTRKRLRHGHRVPGAFSQKRLKGLRAFGHVCISSRTMKFRPP